MEASPCRQPKCFAMTERGSMSCWPLALTTTPAAGTLAAARTPAVANSDCLASLSLVFSEVDTVRGQGGIENLTRDLIDWSGNGSVEAGSDEEGFFGVGVRTSKLDTVSSLTDALSWPLDLDGDLLLLELELERELELELELELLEDELEYCRLFVFSAFFRFREPRRPLLDLDVWLRLVDFIFLFRHRCLRELETDLDLNGLDDDEESDRDLLFEARDDRLERVRAGEYLCRLWRECLCRDGGDLLLVRGDSRFLLLDLDLKKSPLMQWPTYTIPCTEVRKIKEEKSWNNFCKW